eukprot:1190574-Prorocentrum_minimum.AAC.1
MGSSLTGMYNGGMAGGMLPYGHYGAAAANVPFLVAQANSNAHASGSEARGHVHLTDTSPPTESTIRPGFEAGWALAPQDSVDSVPRGWTDTRLRGGRCCVATAFRPALLAGRPVAD